MTTCTITPSENTEKKTTARVALVETAATPRVPLFVPRDQLYFWSREWQLGEAEALREIADGNVCHFPSGTAAAQWLLSDED